MHRRFLRKPDPRLRPLLYRPLYGIEQKAPGFGSWLEPPRPAVTLIVDFEGAITANGERLPDAWIGGLSESYTLVGVSRNYASLDIKLTPLGAYTVLGTPMDELAGLCVSLAELFGGELVERLREEHGWQRRFDLLEGWLLARAAVGPRPTPSAARAVELVHQTGGKVPVEALALELGCSRRHLTRQFTTEVGLAPKAFARQVRFASVCRRVQAQPAAWSRIAAEAGYCDQSHLNRDFRELAGTTPTEFVSRLLPSGEVIGDGIPFVQDGLAARA